MKPATTATEAILDGIQRKQLRGLIVQSSRSKVQSRLTSPVEVIKAVVAERMGVSVSVMESDSRVVNIVWARHVALYCIWELTGLYLQEIGREFPRNGVAQHHSTVLHALHCVKDRMETELPARLLVKQLLDDLSEELKQL